MKPPEIIETARLILRKPAPEDAEAIFTGYARDPEVTRYLTWPSHRNIGDTVAFLADCLRDWAGSTGFGWAITEKDDDRCIGMAGVRIDDFKANLGYVLSRSCWGKGIMTEAAAAVVEWALSQPGIFRVWAVCDCENQASARVMEKIGMNREGKLRRWSLHPNVSPEPRDCFCYAKVKQQ